jgi:oxygen-dependent protoporphyrinogen oxidase
MAAGVYAGDPAALSARDAFPSLAAPGSILWNALRAPRRPGLWSLRRGLGSLPESIAAKLAVRLGTPVTALQPSRGGWQVLAGGATERFDAVVLAVPASQAAALARGFAPRLADALGGFRAAPVALVHLGFRQGRLPRGFGMLDADGALHATGTLFPSSMLPGRAPEGRALLSAVCGGARHPERAHLPEPALVAAVCADLSRALGVKGDPEYVRITRHAEAIPQYAPGHSARVRSARDLLANLPPLKLAGASYDGVSVPAAAHSGSAAAAALLP